MIKLVPLSLNLLDYLLKLEDRDIIMMADDFYYDLYPESIKLGKKQNLQDLAEKKGAQIFEYCKASGVTSMSDKNYITAGNGKSMHAFFVVNSEMELEERFSVIEVLQS